MGKLHPGYEYQMVNVSLTPYSALEDPTKPPTLMDAVNHWSGLGWRVVQILPAKELGHAVLLFLERRKQNPHNRYATEEANNLWWAWEEQYGE